MFEQILLFIDSLSENLAFLTGLLFLRIEEVLCFRANLGSFDFSSNRTLLTLREVSRPKSTDLCIKFCLPFLQYSSTFCLFSFLMFMSFGIKTEIGFGVGRPIFNFLRISSPILALGLTIEAPFSRLVLTKTFYLLSFSNIKFLTFKIITNNKISIIFKSQTNRQLTRHFRISEHKISFLFGSLYFHVSAH